MIDYREFDDIQDDGYEFFKDKQGVIYKVELLNERQLIKVLKLQFVINELQKEYGKLIKAKESEKSFDKLDEIYNKILDINRDLFLMILNSNTDEKKFTKTDISKIPLNLMQNEINSYLEYVSSKLKN